MLAKKGKKMNKVNEGRNTNEHRFSSQINTDKNGSKKEKDGNIS